MRTTGGVTKPGSDGNVDWSSYPVQAGEAE